MHPTLHALWVARDATDEGRADDAATILADVAPDFEYMGLARPQPKFKLASFERDLREAYPVAAVAQVAMRKHPLLAMLRKAGT